jgi:hypothetical protein
MTPDDTDEPEWLAPLREEVENMLLADGQEMPPVLPIEIILYDDGTVDIRIAIVDLPKIDKGDAA